jgi:hypothetical protein
MTRVIETDAAGEQEEERWIDAESQGDGWDDDGGDAIPPRPRGLLLRPLPLALIAVTIAAAGFLGGVLAQKGSEGGGAAAGPGGGSLPAFAAARAAAGGAESAGGEGGSGETGSGSTTEGATGLPSFGGASAAATRTVASVSGHTIYVKESDGTVVAVKAGDGSTVTRDSNVAAKKIHRGDTIVVQGSKHGSTVKASSIAATESGVESTAALGAPTTGASESAGGAESETSVESLFEE